MAVLFPDKKLARFAFCEKNIVCRQTRQLNPDWCCHLQCNGALIWLTLKVMAPEMMK
jgi:hypothetical protein